MQVSPKIIIKQCVRRYKNIMSTYVENNVRWPKMTKNNTRKVPESTTISYSIKFEKKKKKKKKNNNKQTKKQKQYLLHMKLQYSKLFPIA